LPALIELLDVPGLLAAGLAGVGMLQVSAGLAAVRRFGQRASTPASAELPAVTVLKPLHGDEPLLEDALASFLVQDYPAYQVVFGLQDKSDPALAVIHRLRARFPDADIEVVVDATQHGVNKKIGNLINMLPAARHDVLVIADSDMHAERDYLREVVATLQKENVGLVTTLYAGRPAGPGLPGQLGTSQITHGFLPGALLARALGRQDCLGATMALRRETLEAVGGLPALVHHLADDAVLGQLVNRLGLETRLAGTVLETTVPERHFSPLVQHELRWGRTIVSLVPVGYAASAIGYPVFWSALAILLSGSEAWAWFLFALAWLARAVAARGIDRALGLDPITPFWLLPLRDLLSVSVIVASYAGDEVEWRGQVLSTTRPSLAAPGEG
jgi:ceramide glucosyltransferase